MLLPRIIPCLLFDENEDMVKTINFKHGSRRYIGDIENAVKIFSEKKADELIVIDIDASKKKEINYELIEKLVANCKMPLAYGGGIKNLEQAKKVFSLGVEKIILSSVIFENIYLINDISKYFGSQSVAVCLDIKINSRYLKLYSKNGTNEHKEIDFQSILNKIQELGAGELIINSVDRDGAMKGYDLEILKFFFHNLKIPLTLLGGAGHIDHFIDALKKFPISGLAAGSFFIYKGKNKAVLLNYPDIKKILRKRNN